MKGREEDDLGTPMFRMGRVRKSGWSRVLDYPDLPAAVEQIVDDYWAHDDYCHVGGCPGVGFCAFVQPREGHDVCPSRECDCTRLAVALLAEEVSRVGGHPCPPGKVVRKFDGGRVALLCAACNVIVGWES